MKFYPEKFIREGSPAYLVCGILICMIVINTLLSLLFYYGFGVTGDTVGKSEEINLLKVLAMVVVAPFVETFISQALPVYFFSMFSFFKERNWLIALLAGLGFSLFHTVPLKDHIVIFIAGFILTMVFILRKENKGFWIVAIIHALWNAFVVVIELIKG